MNETGERFVKADVIYVMPDLTLASDVVISSGAEKSQLIIADSGKSITFAVESNPL